MLKVTITEARIDVRKGVSKKSGQPYEMHEQPARLQYPNGEVRNIALSHEPGDAPFPAGEYTAKDSAFYHGKFGPEVSLRAKHWLLSAAQRKAA